MTPQKNALMKAALVYWNINEHNWDIARGFNEQAILSILKQQTKTYTESEIEELETACDGSPLYQRSLFMEINKIIESRG